MPTIEVPVGQPHGDILVNIDLICAAVPDLVSPDRASSLLINSAGGRSITALLKISEIGKLLGNAFVEFTVADAAKSTCFVNRTIWVSIVPHPQVRDVTQINFAHRRYLPVTGTINEVIKQLEGGSSAKSARRAQRR